MKPVLEATRRSMDNVTMKNIEKGGMHERS